MQYKVSFIDKMGNEYMGTTEHFTTDGRYSLDTVYSVALDTVQKKLYKHDIAGYVVRKNSFNSKVIATVIF